MNDILTSPSHELGNFTLDKQQTLVQNYSSSMTDANLVDLENGRDNVSRVPVAILIAGNVYLCVNILFTWLTNVTLITVIVVSPNLKTPPNNHLINICVNNILLSCCMTFSVIAVNIRHLSDSAHALLAGFQVFIVTNAFLQYWNTFTAIGYYRLRTIKTPSLSTKIRREIIHKCIAASWLVSMFLSLIFTLSSVDISCVPMKTLSPFRYEFLNRPTDRETSELKLVAVACVILVAFLADLFLIVGCYYRIFMVLGVTGSLGKNRVSPWHQPSFTSDSTDLTLPMRRVYKPMENNWVKPYTVSENFIVHFQKAEHTLDFDDVLALENPIVAANIRGRHVKKPLRATISNASVASTKSKNSPDFTDISVCAELQRIQKHKNNSALRNQFLKMDRISLSSATKNSLAMLCAFVLCSIPLFICTCPGILSSLDPGQRLTALAICRYLFYLNGPAYPTWYLLFSKRVKKCLTRVTENIYHKCRRRKY
ncbi:uncharacterized protein LOC135476864 [Liolophura sinensis]|uniref:uncharacterized protein LOC135476864 n=1 Tax=Liolophura sinensis TaxID=3198878 RepID=UPI0031591695